MEALAKLLNKDGILTRWPKNPTERTEVLTWLLEKFESDKQYTEMEVNAIIKKWHTFNDHPMLRRELVNLSMLDRSPDGKAYWKKQP